MVPSILEKFSPADWGNNITYYIHLGRPPWFNKDGGVRKEPFFIGISGGSASGKTTVATNIIKQLDVQWVIFREINFTKFFVKMISLIIFKYSVLVSLSLVNGNYCPIFR